MAKSDIELRIIAKNEAQSVINNIIGSFKKFSNETRVVGGDAKSMTAHLAKVATEFKQLNASVGGGGFFKAVADELQVASLKAERLGKESRESAQHLARVAIDSHKVAQELKEVRAESDQLVVSLERQQIATDKVTKRQSELASQAGRFAAGKQKLVEANERLNGTLRKGSTLSDKQKQANRDRIISNNELIRQFDIQAGRNERKQATQEKHYRREKALLDPLLADKERLKALDRALLKNQRDLGKAQRTGSNALIGDSGKARTAMAELERLELAATEAEGGLIGLERTLKARLRPAFIDLGKSLREARTDYKRYKGDVEQLGAALSKTANPTEQQIAAFKLSKQAARDGAKAIDEYTFALRRALQANRGSGGDLSAIQARHNRTAGYLQQADNVRQSKATPEMERLLADYRRLEEQEKKTAAAAEKETAAQKKNERQHRRTAAATRSHSRAQTGLQAAFAKFYGNNRIQLSLLQRLRTELHGLVLAYGGLFAIVGGITKVIGSFITIQKAENRLRSVVGDDSRLIGQELEFIRRNAERLGAEFGVLSNEYTKFSIATKNTRLEGQKTRDIFVSVAEAARVNGADNEGLAGTFLALTQIVSKGTVTMEELKRQLGDRLPGAVHIMADALGIGTAELFKIIEAGELTSDVLVQFADELDNRFGPGLSKALLSTQAQIGRLQNELFQTQLRVGRGGFIEAFNDLLATMIETMRSPEFQSFTDRLSIGLSAVTDAVGFLIHNWDYLVAGLAAFGALKTLPLLVYGVGRLTDLGVAMTGVGVRTHKTRSRVSRFTRAIGLMGSAFTSNIPLVRRFGFALKFLRIAIRQLLPILTIAAVAYAYFFTKGKTAATDANEVLSAHRKYIDDIANAWQAAGGSISKFREELKKLSSLTSQVNATQSRDLLAERVKAAGELTARARADAKGQSYNYQHGFASPIDEDGINQRNVLKANTDISDRTDIARNRLEIATTADAVRDEIATYKADIEKIIKDASVSLNGLAVRAVSSVSNEQLKAIEGVAEAALPAILGVEGQKLANATEYFDNATAQLTEAEQKLNSAKQSFALLPNDTHKQALTEAENHAEYTRVLLMVAKENLADLKNILLDEGGQDIDLGPRFEKLKNDSNGFADSLNRTDAEIKRAKEIKGFASTYKNIMLEVASLKETMIEQDGEIAKQSAAWGELDRIATQATEAQANGIREADAAWVDSVFKSAPGVEGGGAYALLDALTEKAGSLKEELAAIGVIMKKLEVEPFGGFADYDDKTKGIIANAVRLGQITRDDPNTDAHTQAQIDGALQGIDDDIATSDIDGLIKNVATINPTLGRYLAENRDDIANSLAAANEKILKGEADVIDTLAQMHENNALNELAKTNPREAHAQRFANNFARGTEFEDVDDIKEAKQAGYRDYDLNQKKDKDKDPLDDLLAELEALKAEKEAKDALFIEKRVGVPISEYRTDPTLGGLRDRSQELGLELIPEKAQAVIDYIKAQPDVLAPANQQIIAEMELFIATNKDAANRVRIAWEDTTNTLAGSFNAGFDTFIEQIVKTEKGIESLGLAFRAFASDFLIQIGQMIQKQVALNLAQNIVSAISPGGFIASVLHAGGIAGVHGTGRYVGLPDTWTKFHGGGVAGFAADEIPAVLRKGEEVLRDDDPRHRNNFKGGGRSGPVNVTTIVVKDEKEANDMYLDTPEGEGKIVKIVNDMLGG